VESSEHFVEETRRQKTLIKPAALRHPAQIKSGKANLHESALRANRIHVHAGDAARRKARVRRRDRSAEIDAATGVFDDNRAKAFALRVLGRVAHAEIECEADDKGALESSRKWPASPVGVARSFSRKAE
jgi:hypothetical protein